MSLRFVLELPSFKKRKRYVLGADVQFQMAQIIRLSILSMIIEPFGRQFKQNFNAFKQLLDSKFSTPKNSKECR